MTETQALVRLMTWLSPAFPIGGFSYSHGLEAAIADGAIASKDDLYAWLKVLLELGSVWNDCVLVALAFNANDEAEFARISSLAEALAGSYERHLETMKQGAAFTEAAKPWNDIELAREAPLPVLVGALGRSNGIELEALIAAYAQAFISNQLQAALRLMKLGQTNALNVQKQLEPALLDVAGRAALATEIDLGSASIGAEIAAMKHETLSPRIFRS